MSKRYPKEFREDVVRVARNREPGVTLDQIASDFGVSKASVGFWLRAADVEDGIKPGTTAADNDDLVQAHRGSASLSERTCWTSC